MTIIQTREHVAALAKRAAEAPDSCDALRFSQAATNLANALCSLQTAPTIK